MGNPSRSQIINLGDIGGSGTTGRLRTPPSMQRAILYVDNSGNALSQSIAFRSAATETSDLTNHIINGTTNWQPGLGTWCGIVENLVGGYFEVIYGIAGFGPVLVTVEFKRTFGG